ncbi:hypothetical protein K8I61_08295 [bacterium]|nr:hypothetical protein [bacterium]
MLLELLKKYFWIAKLVFVAILASEIAMLVNTRVESRLAEQVQVDVADVNVKTPNAFVSVTEYVPIYKNNLFNNDYVYVEKSDAAQVVAPRDYRLIGTIAWGEPQYSMAVINTVQTNDTKVYRVGEDLADNAYVKKIERRRVTVDREGTEIVLELPDEPTQLAAVSPIVANVELGDEQIKQVGEGQFVVSRDVIEGGFNNPAMWMKGARVMPNFEKGNIAGFKLLRIKPDSLYSKIGLKDGDVIRRINNIEIRGPEDAFRLMSELRGAKTVSLDITRGGQRQSFSYQVR